MSSYTNIGGLVIKIRTVINTLIWENCKWSLIIFETFKRSSDVRMVRLQTVLLPEGFTLGGKYDLFNCCHTSRLPPNFTAAPGPSSMDTKMACSQATSEHSTVFRALKFFCVPESILRGST